MSEQHTFCKAKPSADGKTLMIRYDEKLYRKYSHRHGEQMTTESGTVTLDIGRIKQ